MRVLIFLLAWLTLAPAFAQSTSRPSCDCTKITQRCRRIMAKAKTVIALQKARHQRDLDKLRANADLQKRLSNIENQKLRRQIGTLTKAIRGPPVLPWVLVGIAGTAAIVAGILAGVEVARRIDAESKLSKLSAP